MIDTVDWLSTLKAIAIVFSFITVVIGIITAAPFERNKNRLSGYISILIATFLAIIALLVQNLEDIDKSKDKAEFELNRRLDREDTEKRTQESFRRTERAEAAARILTLTAITEQSSNSARIIRNVTIANHNNLEKFALTIKELDRISKPISFLDISLTSAINIPDRTHDFYLQRLYEQIDRMKFPNMTTENLRFSRSAHKGIFNVAFSAGSELYPDKFADWSWFGITEGIFTFHLLGRSGDIKSEATFQSTPFKTEFEIGSGSKTMLIRYIFRIPWSTVKGTGALFSQIDLENHDILIGLSHLGYQHPGSSAIVSLLHSEVMCSVSIDTGYNDGNYHLNRFVRYNRRDWAVVTLSKHQINSEINPACVTHQYEKLKNQEIKGK